MISILNALFPCLFTNPSLPAPFRERSLRYVFRFIWIPRGSFMLRLALHQPSLHISTQLNDLYSHRCRSRRRRHWGRLPHPLPRHPHSFPRTIYFIAFSVGSQVDRQHRNPLPRLEEEWRRVRRPGRPHLPKPRHLRVLPQAVEFRHQQLRRLHARRQESALSVVLPVFFSLAHDS